MQTVALLRQASRFHVRRRRFPPKCRPKGRATKFKKLFDTVATLPYTSATDGAAALSGR